MQALEKERDARGRKALQALEQYFAKDRPQTVLPQEALHWLLAHRLLDVGAEVQGLSDSSQVSPREPAKRPACNVMQHFPVISISDAQVRN